MINFLPLPSSLRYSISFLSFDCFSFLQQILMSRNEPEFQFLPPSENQRDSLRWSSQSCAKEYDFDLSTDGPQLSFIIEDQAQLQKSFDSQASWQSKSKRKISFSKYRRQQEKKEEKTENGILKTFDEVFGMGENQKRTEKRFSKKRQKSFIIKEERKTTDTEAAEEEKPMLRERVNSTTSAKRDQQITYEQFLDSLQKSDSKQAFSDKAKEKGEETVFEYGLNEKKGRDFLNEPLPEEESRFPIFLREVRKLNSIYPNFHHPNFKKEEVENQLRKLLQSLSKAIDELIIIGKKVEEKNKGQLMFSETFSDAFTLKYFLNSKWEQSKSVKEVKRIQPTVPFERRPVNIQKINKALTSYKGLVQHYVKNVKVDQPCYLQLRNKLWSVEKNLKVIAEDVYTYYLNYQFPFYYYEYLYALRSPAPKEKGELATKTHRRILSCLVQNQHKGEPLSCSQIGKKVREKLEKELRVMLLD